MSKSNNIIILPEYEELKAEERKREADHWVKISIKVYMHE